MLNHVRALNARTDRRRSRWLLGAVVAAVAAVALAAPGEAGPAAPSAAAAAATKFGFAIQLGPEERVIGPTGDVDVLYFSERDARHRLIGFAGTSRTYVWRSQANRRISHPRLIINRGRAGSFDECGAWLNGSVFKLTRRHWIGFYHAESKGPRQSECDRVHDTVVFRVGFVQTWDAGRTWTKRIRGYSHNVVLTGRGTAALPSNTSGSNNGGSPRVVQVDGFYYMFFMAGEVGSAQTYVARAPVSSQGRPGAWKKWFCHPATLVQPAYCAFDEPAIGGRSTPVSGLAAKARYVTWNNHLRRWIGFYGSGKIGFRMYASAPVTGSVTEAAKEASLLSWDGSDPFYAPVSTEDDPLVDQWGTHIRNRRSRLLYAYPSMLGATGSSRETGKSFYIYYVKLYPGDNFDERYLFRRRVTVAMSDVLDNRVALTTYKKRDGRRRTSTDMPKDRAFRRETGAGYLLGGERDGWRQVIECTRRGDAALFTGGCQSGWAAYRRVGWLSPEQTAEASVPIYRCLNRRLGNHFASTSPTCNGAKREIRLGFGLRGF